MTTSYLLIKNCINVFCKDMTDVNKALADVKDKKGVRLFEINEIEIIRSQEFVAGKITK